LVRTIVVSKGGCTKRNRAGYLRGVGNRYDCWPWPYLSGGRNNIRWAGKQHSHVYGKRERHHPQRRNRFPQRIGRLPLRLCCYSRRKYSEVDRNRHGHGRHRNRGSVEAPAHQPPAALISLPFDNSCTLCRASCTRCCSNMGRPERQGAQKGRFASVPTQL